MNKAVAIGIAVAALALTAPGASASTSVSTSTFVNPSPIAPVPDSGPAASTSITVSGTPGAVLKATATVRNITHSIPSDLDALLAGPAGTASILFSDVCAAPMSNVSLTLDDAAPLGFDPSGAQTCPTGTYRPLDRNDGSADTFSPAPAGPRTASMANFNGVDPNGTWALFVSDDFALDDGSIGGGWTLELTIATCLAQSPTPSASVGTASDDVLTGTPASDVLVGLGGNDTIRSGGGRDVVCGGDGRDKLLGQSGRDTLLGEADKDKINGGRGRDICKGGAGNDSGSRCEKEKSL